MRQAVLGAPGVTGRAIQGRHVWMQLLGDQIDVDGDGNAAAIDHQRLGFLAGAETTLDNGAWLGVAGGVSDSEFDIDDRASRADSSAMHAALYGGWTSGQFTFRAGGSHSWLDLSVDRTVAIGSITESLSSDRDGSASQMFGEVSYAMPREQLTIEPFAGLSWARTKLDGTTETGGSSALQASESTLETTYATVGVRLSGNMRSGNWAMRPWGSVAWEHAFDDDAPMTTNQFVAGGPTFAISGAPLGQSRGLLSLGVSASSSRVGVEVGYSGAFGSEASSHGLQATARLAF